MKKRGLIKKEVLKNKPIISPNTEVKLTTSGNIKEIAYNRKLRREGPPIRKIDKNHYIDYREPLSKYKDLYNDSYKMSTKIIQAFGGGIDTARQEDFNISIYTDPITGEQYIPKYFKSVFNTDLATYKQPEDLRRTFKQIRNLINVNTSVPENVRCMTLTYKENIIGSEGNKKFGEDWEKFFRKFVNQYPSDNGNKIHYIVVMEPQGRGSWHCHAFIIYPHKAPFIHYSIIEKMWGNGSTSFKGLDTTNTNPGAYFSAYLSDIEVSQASDMKNYDSIEQAEKVLTMLEDERNIEEKEVYEYDNTGNITGKIKNKFLKGGRLHFYPKYMKLFRASQGIPRSTSEYMPYSQAKLECVGDTLTYEKSVRIVSEEFDYVNVFHYEYYQSNLSPEEIIKKSIRIKELRDYYKNLGKLEDKERAELLEKLKREQAAYNPLTQPEAINAKDLPTMLKFIRNYSPTNISNDNINLVPPKIMQAERPNKVIKPKTKEELGIKNFDINNLQGLSLEQINEALQNGKKLKKYRP